MQQFAAILALPILSLIALALLPSGVANKHSKTIRQGLTWLLGAQCVLALIVAVGYVATGSTPWQLSVLDGSLPEGLAFSIYYDGATALMLVLVSFVGCIVSRYSIRYLDGEAMQGRYYRWLGFAIGAVSLLVVSGNLLQFFLAWVMTSFGLHQLLLHYRHREAAHRAAWTKFAISRLGDALLIAAMVLIYNMFGTFEFSELFAAANALVGSGDILPGHIAIGWLLMLGAATKSAQFPFHTWLPDTMETPTPVSALMHAGIVNAGGYLIIRMSSLVGLAPAALATLAVLGAFTACLAGIVMMTQPSVKRALAYSTIAQMGFMMLQCGLGAFSAAMLHIIAHSLYKAHAFLSSGSVISQRLATAGAKSPQMGLMPRVLCIALATFVSVTAFFGVAYGLGLDIVSKPGGPVLGFILCVALATWGWQLLAFNRVGTIVPALIGMFGLSIAYLGSYLLVSQMVEPTQSVAVVSFTSQMVGVGIVVAFSLLLVLHVAIMARVRPVWLQAMRVHAENGFYIDAVYQRLFSSLAKS